MLVEKINAYLDQEKKSLTESFKYLLKSEYAQLSGFSFSRQFLEDRESSSGELRFSSAGKCVRALAYGKNGFVPNGKTLDSRGKLTFFFGDMVEIALVILAKAADVPLFGYGLQQPRTEWKLSDGTVVMGHPDGFHLQDGKIRSVEFKSMNTNAFERFDRGEIDESHLMQANSNMKAQGTDECIYVAMDKNTSVLGEKIIYRSEKMINEIEQKFLTVINSTKDALPERPYTPNEKRFLPWNCLYCNHHKTCYPTAVKVLAGDSYRLRVPVDYNKEAEATLIYQEEGKQ